MAKAAALTEKIHGEDILLRGLLEYSNFCKANCLYCGIRGKNRKVNRYRIDQGLLVEAALGGYRRGIRTFVLQGGEDPLFSTERICQTVEAIKKACRQEVAITLSCGMRSAEEYQEMRLAGGDRYLLRFETSDPQLHYSLRNGSTLKERLLALENIRSAGFQIGSGFMVGLPGEDDAIRLNNVLLAQELSLDMVGIGPFIPHPETPLADAPQRSLNLALRGVALLRLALPLAHIPATTAAGSLNPTGREQMICAGANVLMPNLTQVEYKKDYELYPGKICLDESGIQCIGCLEMRVRTVDRRISFDRGDALRLQQGIGQWKLP